MKSIGEVRLKNVLGGDKKQNPEKMIKIVKGEIYYILKDYFELDSDDINISISVENNKYNIEMSFQSNNIKIANIF